MRAEQVEQALELRERLAEVYADTRFPPTARWADLRSLVITLMWVCYGEPHIAGRNRWDRVCELLNYNHNHFWELIREDAPRYKPAEEWRGCIAPMPRKGGLCGKSGRVGSRATNPVDGTWRMAWFCNRHSDSHDEHQAREAAQRSAGGIPEPLPNAGGLLPCYFDYAWPEMYARARAGWTPPAAGICADDWPTMAKVLEKQPPKLQLLTGDPAHEALPLPSGDRPVLTLIRSKGPAPTQGPHKEGTT